MLSEDNISGSFHESEDVSVGYVAARDKSSLSSSSSCIDQQTCALTLDEGIPQDGSSR